MSALTADERLAVHAEAHGLFVLKEQLHEGVASAGMCWARADSPRLAELHLEQLRRKTAEHDATRAEMRAMHRILEVAS